MESAYLIRYGVMRHVGRFAADEQDRFERGQAVVVRSHRGVELGEVLAPAYGTPPAATAEVDGIARVLRPAGPDDLERARRAERERPDCLRNCLQVFEAGAWPIDLLDVEPLLDEGRVVLHYLGPHRLDVDGLLAAFRERHRYDVMFQPAGRDEPEPVSEPGAAHGCGSCGVSGGCGAGGGGCGTSAGCQGCGIQQLLASRR